MNVLLRLHLRWCAPMTSMKVLTSGVPASFTNGCKTPRTCSELTEIVFAIHKNTLAKGRGFVADKAYVEAVLWMPIPLSSNG